MICSICGQLLEDCEETDLCIEANELPEEAREDNEDYLIDPGMGDK